LTDQIGRFLIVRSSLGSETPKPAVERPQVDPYCDGPARREQHA
jgi:hypothetical protein